MRKLFTVIALVALLGLSLWQQYGGDGSLHPPEPGSVPGAGMPASSPVLPAFLPAEARPVLERILRAQPHPYRQDGSTFQNRERRLPRQANGYYREYTVPTPGSRDRGARRIVTGGDPPVEYWYTADHYRSFRRFEVER